VNSRRGEKIGWTAGWLGAFVWVFITAVIFLFQRKYIAGFTGMLLFIVSTAAVLHSSPWRYPSTPYWKLMIVPYGGFFASVIWGIWAFGGFSAIGLYWWVLLFFLSLLIPLANLYKRKWSDFDDERKSASGADTLRD